MANPAGALSQPDALKSWEIRDLREITWKHSHDWVSSDVSFVKPLVTNHLSQPYLNNYIAGALTKCTAMEAGVCAIPAWNHERVRR